MRDYRSNFRQAYRHPNIVVALSLELDAEADWLLAYFESEIQRGVFFYPEETVQIGWMLVKLKADESGDLELWEPRFDHMPISWTRGADTTIRHLMLQRQLCAQLDVEPSFPSLRQTGIVTPDFLVTSIGFVMSREESDGNDSGWLFREFAYQGRNGRHCSLFEVAVSRLAIVPFLALPAGVTVTRSEGDVRITYGSLEISSSSNDFIGRIFRKLGDRLL